MIRSAVTAVRPHILSAGFYPNGPYSILRQAALEAATRNNAAIWFVEQDRSNIFANSDGSGGTPTNGGVIGLVLPNRNLRGPELFAGGDGSSLGTWTTTGATVTLDNGEFRINTSGAFGGVSRVITTVVGRWYECRATYRNGTADAATIFLRPNGADTATDQVQFPNNTTGANVTHTRYIRATTTQMFIRFTSLRNAGSDVCYFDNLSFREVEGSPLESPTTGQKPTLVQPGGATPNRIGFHFDGVDDRLRAFRTPLSTSPGDPYTLIFSGQSSSVIAGGGRMAVSDGRALGLNGNGTSQQAESLHGGAARYAFPAAWPANGRRVLAATWSGGAGGTLIQRQGGTQVASLSGTVAQTTIVTSDAYVGARSGAVEFWSGDIFLACAAPGVMPLADIRAIEQFAAFIGDAPYV